MSILYTEQSIREATAEISLSDPVYPPSWKGLSNPPQTLYAVGDATLLRTKKLAIVGSRRTPVAALKVGREMAKELSETFTLITGTADGGDSAAIEGALQGSGKIICLLAGGLSALPQANLPLLDEVAKRGLLLSASPFDTPVRPFSYEHRNQLLAKCAVGVLVLGAGEKSGALITAKYAVQYKKPVFALPYPPNAAYGCGCNRLIKEGGYLVESAADILETYGIVREEKKQAKISLTPDEEKIYLVLKEVHEAHVNELAERCQTPVFKLRGGLSALEVKGLVVALGGNRYAVIK